MRELTVNYPQGYQQDLMSKNKDHKTSLVGNKQLALDLDKIKHP